MSEREDLTITPIRKGQLASFEVKGGYVRAPAPHDGLLIETTTSTVLLAAEDVARAMSKLPKQRTVSNVVGLSKR
jgi:hypothetical protein